MILPIYLEPQPILRLKTSDMQPAELSKHEFQELVTNMVATMSNAEGVGLAAPQVGLPKRLTVINLKAAGHRFNPPQTNNNILALINPLIKKKTFKKNFIEEGCLSIPGIYGTVKRPVGITIKYLDQDGNKQELSASGLLARVIQHEIDHLDGILFTDRVKKYTSTAKVRPNYSYIE